MAKKRKRRKRRSKAQSTSNTCQKTPAIERVAKILTDPDATIMTNLFGEDEEMTVKEFNERMDKEPKKD